VILASERAAWKKSNLIIYDRILSYFTDKIICNSRAVKRYQIETEKINSKKLEVVYNGIDLEDFDKRLKLAREKADQYKKELGIKENEVVIGNVCRFTPEKNLEDWLKTAFLLLKENKNLKFLLVGNANPKIEEELPYKERILKLMKELNLENNIILTGESLEVTRELAIMDLFFQSSISEGFPNSLMEAMATSLAIVATPAGGTRELVTKETGIILEFENKKNWPKIILELISNKNKMEKIGKKGRERIEKHFTNKILAKNIERIYLSLFGQN
jgi:glycosyltransferase involved in cell wall biosynthesis